MPEPTPECPFHGKAMIRLETSENTHYRCSRQGCVVHWNPAVTFFYLKAEGDWPLREGEGYSN